MESITKKLNVTEELEKINLSTIYEYEKTIDNFDIEKIKLYITKDSERTVCLIFYGNQFIAINRVNYDNGYEYDDKKLIVTENLNYRIRKIPNVAKTRKILKINDIEARIYDVAEYVILLTKENLQIFRVTGQSELTDLKFDENTLDVEKYKQYECEQEEHLKLEESENKKISILEVLKHLFVDPIILLKNKLTRTSEVKLLSDGNQSLVYH